MRKERALGPLLGRAGHLGRERMDARLSRFDVTPSQTHLLMYLHSHGGQAPQCDVTAFLRVRPSTVNGIIDRLEEKGMVKRSISGNDARRRQVALTEKGRAQQELFLKTFQEVEAMMLRGFSPEETERFYSMLERVIQNLEEDRTDDEKTLAPREALCEMDRRGDSVRRGRGDF